MTSLIAELQKPRQIRRCRQIFSPLLYQLSYLSPWRERQ